MADFLSTSLNERIERLTAEGLISMRDAAKLYGRNTHRSTPTRHAAKGVRLADGTTAKLEAIRVGGALCTSRAAVMRFFAAQQGDTGEPQPITQAPTPKRRAGAAAKAHDEVAELLGAKG